MLLAHSGTTCCVPKAVLFGLLVCGRDWALPSSGDHNVSKGLEPLIFTGASEPKQSSQQSLGNRVKKKESSLWEYDSRQMRSSTRNEEDGRKTKQNKREVWLLIAHALNAAV